MQNRIKHYKLLKPNVLRMYINEYFSKNIDLRTKI